MKIKDNLMSVIFSYKEANPEASEVISAGLCKCLAHKAPLPPEKVRSPKNWYLRNNSMVVRSVINDINERYYVDIEKIAGNVYNLWRMRYNLVHNGIPLNDKELNFLSTGTNDECGDDKLRTLKSVTNIFNSYIGD